MINEERNKWTNNFKKSKNNLCTNFHMLRHKIYPIQDSGALTSENSIYEKSKILQLPN